MNQIDRRKYRRRCFVLFCGGCSIVGCSCIWFEIMRDKAGQNTSSRNQENSSNFYKILFH